jgi:hypothetical protein
MDPIWETSIELAAGAEGDPWMIGLGRRRVWPTRRINATLVAAQ